MRPSPFSIACILLCLKKFKEGGVENAIYDTPGRGRNPEITDDEKTWIIDIACRKPTEFGYAAETWTYAKLTSHIQQTAEAAKHARLSTISKTTVVKILDEAEVKPFRIKYWSCSMAARKTDTDYLPLQLLAAMCQQNAYDAKRKGL